MFRDITCEAIVELVTDFLEGALDADRHDELERHLLTCGGCVNYLDQMHRTIELTGALRRDDVPAPMMDRLLDAYRNSA